MLMGTRVNETTLHLEKSTRTLVTVQRRQPPTPVCPVTTASASPSSVVVAVAVGTPNRPVSPMITVSLECPIPIAMVRSRGWLGSSSIQTLPASRSSSRGIPISRRLLPITELG